MFTPEKIENALKRLFDLFDTEVWVDLYENYAEEIEAISPKWLSKAFSEDASPVYEYRAVCWVGDGLDYNSKALFKHRGVKLLSYLENPIENERLRIVSGTELWLLEDMTFSMVQYMGTMVKGDNCADCITEYRRFVKNIKSVEDVFFSPARLICVLDDICMFAQLLYKIDSSKT